ncbi:MAG: DUF364 domain-containing protein [Anaerolineae bacterium]|nr:DUF364 domain-containing protein [Anaerolineae bacterium]
MVSTIDALLKSLSVDAPVAQVLVGAFWTAVVLDAAPPRCGLASTLHGGHQEHHLSGPPLPEAGDLLARGGRELAEWLRSESVLEASIGMAAFNALLALRPELVEGWDVSEINAEDVILERGRGRKVAVVGHFPFVERVRQAAGECWVLELAPRPGDVPAERAAELLPQAEVVAMTGTSLINHTFDDLIALCRPDAFVLLLGASAPLTPVLFDVGVSAISGTRVIDPQAVLRLVGQGATFRQIKRGGGLRLLTMMHGR